MFLFVWIFALSDLLEHNVADAKITWEVTKVPLVFGSNVEIQCRYTSNIFGIGEVSWIWNSGKGNDLIISQGFLAKKYKYEKKYSEKRSPNSHESTFIISNFNESDYNQIYRCGIETAVSAKNYFVEFVKDEITFRNIPYEYNHTKVKVDFEMNSNRKRMTVNIELEKIYPIPQCRFTLYDEDITHAIVVRKKKIGLFYNIVFTMYSAVLGRDRFFCIMCNTTTHLKYSHCFRDNERLTQSNGKAGFVLAVLNELFIISFSVSSSVTLHLLFVSKEEQFKSRLRKQRCVDMFYFFVIWCRILEVTVHRDIENEDVLQHIYCVQTIRKVSIAIMIICFFHVKLVAMSAQDELQLRIDGIWSTFFALMTNISVIAFAMLTLYRYLPEDQTGNFVDVYFNTIYLVMLMSLKWSYVHISTELHEKKLATMYCQYCGENLPITAKFCTECGESSLKSPRLRSIATKED